MPTFCSLRICVVQILYRTSMSLNDYFEDLATSQINCSLILDVRCIIKRFTGYDLAEKIGLRGRERGR